MTSIPIDGMLGIARDLYDVGLPGLIAIATVLAGAVTVTAFLARTRTRTTDPATSPAGAKGFYAVAAMSLLVSVDTSWRFFGNILHITNTLERAAMFAVIEAALIACGYGMRANVRRSGNPGSPRLIAWTLCGVAAFMAWRVSDTDAAVLRVAAGPVLGLVMLHLALGIDMRHSGGKTTNGARIRRELTARFLSRLGLGDDDRTAAARTRDRAGRRVARLAHREHGLFRQARLRRALLASGVAHDPAMRNKILAELAVLRHVDELTDLDTASPWDPDSRPGTVRVGQHRRPEPPARPASPPRRAAAPSRPGTNGPNLHRTGTGTGTNGVPVNGSAAVVNGMAARRPTAPDPSVTPAPVPDAAGADEEGAKTPTERLRDRMRAARRQNTPWEQINATALAREFGLSGAAGRKARADLQQEERETHTTTPGDTNGSDVATESAGA